MYPTFFSTFTNSIYIYTNVALNVNTVGLVFIANLHIFAKSTYNMQMWSTCSLQRG